MTNTATAAAANLRPWNGPCEMISIAAENGRRQRFGLAPLVAVCGVWYFPAVAA